MMSAVVLSSLYLLLLLSPSSSQDDKHAIKIGAPYYHYEFKNISNLNIPQNISKLSIPQNIPNLSIPHKFFDLNIPRKFYDLNIPQYISNLSSPLEIFKLVIPQKISQQDGGISKLNFEISEISRLISKLNFSQDMSTLNIPDNLSKLNPVYFSKIQKLISKLNIRNISKVNLPRNISEFLENISNVNLQDISKISVGDIPKSTSTLNVLVDSMLNLGLRHIDSNMSIADVNEDMKRKGWFTRITVEVTTHGGYITDLKSLRRKADTTLINDGDILRMQAILGFENLAVIFPHYTLSTARQHIKKSGAMKAVVKDNQFLLDFGLKKNEKECKLLFNSFKLLKFKNIEVTMSGGRWKRLDLAWSRIVTRIINRFRNDIKFQLEKKVSGTISKLLVENEEKICKLIRSR
ncbi:hypothetical protein M8J77_004430 [Diaphorina citri]|nr:hypothetical protein M8J77_004430 [Diaphorina citri]